MSENVTLAICTVACAVLAGILALGNHERWAGRITWLFVGMVVGYTILLIARSFP